MRQQLTFLILIPSSFLTPYNINHPSFLEEEVKIDPVLEEEATKDESCEREQPQPTENTSIEVMTPEDLRAKLLAEAKAEKARLLAAIQKLMLMSMLFS